MDDRAAVLERVAELVGDRFGWLTEIGTGVASAPTHIGTKCVAALTASQRPRFPSLLRARPRPSLCPPWSGSGSTCCDFPFRIRRGRRRVSQTRGVGVSQGMACLHLLGRGVAHLLTDLTEAVITAPLTRTFCLSTPRPAWVLPSRRAWWRRRLAPTDTAWLSRRSRRSALRHQ